MLLSAIFVWLLQLLISACVCVSPQCPPHPEI